MRGNSRPSVIFLFRRERVSILKSEGSVGPASCRSLDGEQAPPDRQSRETRDGPTVASLARADSQSLGYFLVSINSTVSPSSAGKQNILIGPPSGDIISTG